MLGLISVLKQILAQLTIIATNTTPAPSPDPDPDPEPDPEPGT